ncbi:MAG TPA: helix-turn-helix domain-containing protein [Pyrinomonadaceae bacterium]|nr:helix-turn-helix domain-containing protein [Pyrinomonadaceae bacterium]
MRRRKGDGCPATGALQVVGDKWTLLIVRDLAHGARRTTELLSSLRPISSRTLVERLREMERDRFVERREFGSTPPHVEYTLTERGRLMLPLLAALRELGEALHCDDCRERFARRGAYCEVCPQVEANGTGDGAEGERASRPAAHRTRADDSIVLL